MIVQPDGQPIDGEINDDGQRVVVYKALPHQLKVLQSKKRRIFLGGGVGSGKTEVGSVWTMMKATEAPEGCYGLIAANTYRQLCDSTIRNLYKNLDKWNIPHRPRLPPNAPRPFSVEIWNGHHYVSILCRSLENYEMLAGIELAFFWCDEVWLAERKAMELVFARDRDTRMASNQGLLTTTLADPSHWLYDVFVEHYNEKLMDVIYAPTAANQANLPDGYIDDMKTLYSERLFRRQVLAEWVTLDEGVIYYAFDKNIHVTQDAEFDPNLPILFSHDFNISAGAPMSSVICQIRRRIGAHGWRPELIVVDEIIIDGGDTNEVIKEMESRGWRYRLKDQRQVYIYGDASGRARDTRSRSSDYDLLAQAGYINQRVGTINPPVRLRHNSCNSLLKNAAGDIRCYINPRCRTLIKGLETVQLKEGTQYSERQTREQHVTTAWGYLITAEFPASGPAGGETALPL